MTKLLENAARFEKIGKFDRALKEYLKVDKTDLTNEEQIFIKRSMVACNFYLQDYDKSEKLFRALLSSDIGLSHDANDIKDSLNICYLYGNYPERACEYFKSKTLDVSLSIESKIWAYWYVGQYYFNTGKYEDSLISYETAYFKSKEIKSNYEMFFMSHMISAYIACNKYNIAVEIIRSSDNETKDNNSKGLLKIVIGIVYKKQNFKGWKKYFNDGMKESKKNWIQRKYRFR